MGLLDYFKPIPKASSPVTAPDLYLPAVPKILAPRRPAPPKPSVDGLAFLKSRATLSFEEKHPEESSEIRRICGLISHYAITPEELDAVCARELLGSVYESGWRLHPEQAALLLAYDENARENVGLFGPIGCGRGKTLASQMLAYRGLKRGIERSVLFIPASVVPQFFNPDLPWARMKVPLDGLAFHNVSASDCKGKLTRSRKPGCYVLSYELFSRPEQAELLESIQPGLVLCDEAHNLARRESTRTKRFMRYVEEHEPQVVAFSGTITGKSIKDYWHIIKACLRLKSPLPVAKTLMEEWAMVLDSDAEPSKAQAVKLRALVEWARKAYPRCLVCHGMKTPATCRGCNGTGKLLFTEDVAGYRKAYTLRLNSAPGVVSSPEDVVGASLVVENRPVADHTQAPGWQQLDKLIKQVDEIGITPSGETIEHSIHAYKWLYELSAGFYNELFWPEVSVYAKRKGITESQAGSVLEKAKKHHIAQQFYAKELRDWLKIHARPNLDSPMLLGGYMKTKGAPPAGEELYARWRDMKALAFEGMPERDSRAVRICPFKVNAAAEWAKGLKGEGGIVWIWNEEIGEWVVETLRAAGLDVFHAPAGEKVNEELKHTPENVKKHGHQIVVASIKAHGTGKNLQWFWNQYMLQWPRAAKLAEQLIARTHREGQKKDELTITQSNTLSFDHANFAACLNDSLYIHQTGGGRQRLIYARYSPLPKIYPSEWLRERGFQVDVLNAEQKALLQEKFGNSG